jgi:hypothetical protein
VTRDPKYRFGTSATKEVWRDTSKNSAFKTEIFENSAFFVGSVQAAILPKSRVMPRSTIKNKQATRAFVRRGLLQSPEIRGVDNRTLPPQRGLGALRSTGKTFTLLIWLQLCPMKHKNTCTNGQALRVSKVAKTRVF